MHKEKQWQPITYGKGKNLRPKERWGHQMVKVGSSIFMFGGYGGVKEGQGKFLKDLWKFDLQHYQWEEVTTSGDIPGTRSNYTLHYYEHRNEVILFGGGTDNKNRFNSIFKLNLCTLSWTQIQPLIYSQAPWQRTYHVAELFKNYLVIFGGQGISNIDLDDTWAFNIQTQEWTKLQPSGDIPQKRRFACSALVGSDFYLIGGCQDYYEQIGEMHKLSLLPLVEGRLSELRWEMMFEGNILLERWGHSTQVYDGRIFIFAGRINSTTDDCQLLQFDGYTNQLNSVQTCGKIPPPRRRHSSVIAGDCMLIFGGYDSHYFNDFSYIKLPKRVSNSEQVFIMDDVNDGEEYKRTIIKCEIFLRQSEKLLISFNEHIIEVPTKLSILKKNSSYFNNALKYDGMVILPEFCSLSTLRVVLMSIISGHVFVWNKQSIKSCFQLVKALDYFCCSQLQQQLSDYLKTKINTQNAFQILQKAVKYKMWELAEQSAQIYLTNQSEQILNKMVVNLDEEMMIRTEVLRVLVQVSNKIRFSIDQCQMRSEKKGFMSQTVELFRNIFCSRSSNQPQSQELSPKRKLRCVIKMLNLAHRALFALGGQTPFHT